MTPPEWKKVQQLYEKVAGLSPDAARAVLEESNEDPAVKREVAMVLDSLHQMLESDGLAPAFGKRGPDSFTHADFAGLAVGRYDVIERIGHGSSGDVYSGRDRELGRAVALKFIKGEHSAAGSAARSFMREAQAASALNHPNIVTVHEVITWEGSPVIVMELVEGAAPRTLCGQALPVARAMGIGRQILQALAFAHAKGIVHRDVKPENVMVRPDGYVKLLDLGLARQSALSASVGNLSSTAGLPVGTLRYMSPEQCRGESATAASDVFAAGIVLYEILTGRHPFYADSPLETAHAIVSLSATPPSRFVPQIPHPVESLILKMLAKQAAERPSAEDAAQQLEDAKAPRRLSYRLAILGVFVIAAVAGVMLFWMRLPRPAERLEEFKQFTYLSPENRPTAAAISPDGMTLAFTDLDGSLHLRGSDGATDRILTRFDKGQIDTISWVPAKRTLVLSGRDLTNDPFAHYRVWTIALDDGSAKELPLKGKRAAPSRDGSRIAYLSPNGAEIWVGNADGTQARRLIVSIGNLKFFAWSADNDLLYYWTVSDRMEALPQLWKGWTMYSVDSTSGRTVTEQPSDVMFAPLALSGGRFLYYRPTVGLFDTRLDKATGRFAGKPQLRALAESELINGRYVFRKDLTASSDGRRISALLARDRKPHVYVADLVTPTKLTNSRRLTLEDSADYTHTWTPDSKAVIVESSRSGPNGIGPNHMYVHPIDRKSDTPLAVLPGDQIVPMVSPDGRWVLFQSSSTKGWNLMRVPMGGGTPELVPTGGPIQEFFCGYKAKRCVLREMQGEQAVFFDLDPVKGKGRELTRVVTGHRVFEDWTVSPDGTMVAMTNIGSLPATVRIIYLDKPPLEKEITFDGPPFMGEAWWTPDGSGWYAAAQDNQMRLLDWAGHNRFVHDSDWWMVPSWDGKHVAYIDSERELNVWMIGR